MMADSEGCAWDWADDADDLVVPEQPAIACYTNPAGDVVLRQRGAWNDDDDAWIWFSPEHARAVAKAILEVAGYEATALAPEPTGGSSKPKDSTGAERQRRRRERQKQETAPALFNRDTVTEAMTETVTRNGNGA